MSRVRVNKLDPFSGQDLTLGGNVVPSNLSASLGSATKFWPSLYVSGNVYFGGLPTCSSTNILVYNPLTGRVCYQTASNFTSTPGGSNRQLQYNNNGAFGGVPNVVYNTTASPSFPSASGANIELTSTDINLITSDVEFGNMGFGVINAVTSISASATSSVNPNGLSIYPSGAAQLNYGVNVIEYANASNYCVKMPATPRKGKELTVINTSGIPIYVFGESAAASLNNIVGNHIVLPSDGIAYKFVCYDNPLPGGWSIVSSSPSTIINSGVIGGLLITQSIYPNQFFYQQNAFISNALYDLGGQTLQTGNGFAYDPTTLHDAGHNGTGPTSPYAYFTPDPNIRKINNITIYTNLSSSALGDPDYLNLTITWASNKRFFKAGTYNDTMFFLNTQFPDYATQLNWFNTSISPFFTDLNLGNFATNDLWAIAGMTSFHNNMGGVFSSTNQVPGTFVPTNPTYTPISSQDWTGYLSANPGDPGTTYYSTNVSNNANINDAWLFGKGLGQFFLGTSPSNVVDADGDQVDAWWLSTFGFNFSLNKTAYINGLKLKIVIDYEVYN